MTLMHPMLTDWRLAHLPFIYYVTPAAAVAGYITTMLGAVAL